MAKGNKKNVIVGAASVYIGPTGTARPADPNPAATPADNRTYRQMMEDDADGSTATADGTLVTNWRNVGYTQDGLEVSTDPSYGEVEVDQLLDAAIIFKDGMGLSVSTTFAEATLENLLVAWGQQGSTLNTATATAPELEIDGGQLGEAPVERGLIAIGNAPKNNTGGGINNYGERIYHVYRVLSVESTSVSMARADASTIPVTFRALPEDTGKYGVVRDRFTTT